MFISKEKKELSFSIRFLGERINGVQRNHGIKPIDKGTTDKVIDTIVSNRYISDSEIEAMQRFISNVDNVINLQQQDLLKRESVNNSNGDQ